MTSLLFIVIALTLLISFSCSLLEAIFLSIPHSHIMVLCEKELKTGKRLSRLRRNMDQSIGAILTLNTIANTLGASIGGALALKAFGDHILALFSAGLTLAILIFSEIFPKTIGAHYWRRLAPFAALTLTVLVVVMKPVLIPLAWLNRLISPRSKRQVTVSRADLAILAEIGQREGTIDEEELQVVQNVIRLDEICVREVMTPRTDMVAVPRDSSVAAAKEVMLNAGHFRLPVYEGSLDKIVGVLLARDLLRAEEENQTSIDTSIRPAHCVPDSKLVEDLIREMRKLRINMAIVLDEFGGTAGIVTLEDLIEEIVGEIQDEHEEEASPFEMREGGRLYIAGCVSLNDVIERIEADLPVELYDTIGGYVFGELGRIPVVGDVVECAQGKFEVVSMDGLRVAIVAFSPAKTLE